MTDSHYIALLTKHMIVFTVTSLATKIPIPGTGAHTETPKPTDGDIPENPTALFLTRTAQAVRMVHHDLVL